MCCVNTTLMQLLDVYLNLQHNDGVSDPRPLYVELSSKPDFSKQLQYLEESAAQGKGLEECVTQELREDEKDLASEAVHSSEQSADPSSSVKDGQRQLENRLDTNADNSVNNQMINLTTHSAAPVSNTAEQNKTSDDTVANPTTIDFSETANGGDTQVQPEQREFAPADEDLEGQELAYSPLYPDLEHESVPEDLDNEPEAEAETTKSSAGSSTLQGEVVERREGMVEHRENLENSNSLQVDETEKGDNSLQADFPQAHRLINDNPPNQQDGDGGDILETVLRGQPQSDVEKVKASTETQLAEELVSDPYIPYERHDIPVADRVYQTNDPSHESKELDDETGLGQDFENIQHGEDQGHQDWLEGDEGEQRDYEQSEQDRIEEPQDLSAKDAIDDEEPHSAHNLETSRNTFQEHLLDEEPVPVEDLDEAPIEITPQSPLIAAISESHLQPSTPVSRKRQLESDEEEYLLDDFEG